MLGIQTDLGTYWEIARPIVSNVNGRAALHFLKIFSGDIVV